MGSCVHKLYVGSCFYFTARLALEPQPSVKVPWAACAVPGRLARASTVGVSLDYLTPAGGVPAAPHA